MVPEGFDRVSMEQESLILAIMNPELATIMMAMRSKMKEEEEETNIM